MRLDDAVHDYLTSLADEGRSPRTVDAYRRDLALLEAHLGPDRDVASIRPADLLAFAASPAVRELRDGGGPRHPTSVNRTRSAVRGLFDFLVRAWAIERNPALALRVKAAPAPRATLLPAEGEAALLGAIGADSSWEAARDALMVRLLLATGLRVASLVALHAADVDAEHGRVTYLAKGARRLTVALERGLALELVDFAGGGGPLFTGRHGRRLGVRQVQLRLAGWVEAAGVQGRVTPHALRHTFGTRLYTETRDLRRVQLALGHRSVGTTERYVGG